ncbi:hypothetical protein ACFV29_42310 [Streptomyces sp. NPDC059690]|uniref:hypothetical protein n=1 Tax=Streptomyces sp. NPDC059690 TaxID=3346907 RepID=UPI0036C227E7
MSRWITAVLAALATFVCVTGVLGAWVLPLLLASEADRWVVAAGAGTAVSAVAVVWGERRIAGRAAEHGPEPATPTPAPPVRASRNRSVDVKGNVPGVIITGDRVQFKKGR